MTIRDIRSKVSTANYATYTIRSFGNANDIRYKDLHYHEIPANIKDAEIFIATPTNGCFNSVKHWDIVLL